MNEMFSGLIASNKEVLHFFIFAKDEDEALAKLHEEFNLMGLDKNEKHRFVIGRLHPNIYNPGVYLV